MSTVAIFKPSTSMVSLLEPGLHMRTHTPVYRYVFKWTIENISDFPNGEEEESSIFCIEPDSEWHVTFLKNDTFLYLCLHRSGKNEAKVSYSVSIVDTYDKVLYHRQNTHPFKAGKTKHDTLSRDIVNFIVKLKPLNDKLTFNILLTVKTVRITEEMNQFSVTQDLQTEVLQDLSKDLETLKASEGDFTFMIEGRKLEAHKTILSARSKVFKSMLELNLEENKLNTVYIEDINYITMKAFIDFLYTGKLCDYDFSTAINLYYAADKYELFSLKDICRKILIAKMTKNTVITVLKLAEEHEDMVLRGMADKFYKSDKMECR